MKILSVIHNGRFCWIEGFLNHSLLPYLVDFKIIAFRVNFIMFHMQSSCTRSAISNWQLSPGGKHAILFATTKGKNVLKDFFIHYDVLSCLSGDSEDS